MARFSTLTTKAEALAAFNAFRRITSVAYAATVTPNADTTDLLIVGALTGNITLAAPSGTPVDGQQLALRLVQDGTGGRTVAFNAAYRLPTDGVPTLDPAAGKLTRFLFEWTASASKWDFVGNLPGY